MGVKTRFKRSFFEEVCREYNLGSLRSYSNFDLGCVQTNILLKTSLGKYVFRYYEIRTLDHIQFEVSLLDYLSKHNFLTPSPLKCNSGKFITSHKSKFYAVFDYIPGKHRKRLSSKALNNLLKELAKLHNITECYRLKGYNYREGHDVAYVLKECSLIHKKMNNQLSKERLKIIKDNLNKLEFPKSLSLGIVHADYNLSNLKFEKDKISGVLDFDDACYTHLNYDVASQIWYLAWKRDKIFDKKRARKIIKIYEKYRPLSKVEKKHLFDSLAILILTHMTWSFEGKGRHFDYYLKRLNWLMNIGREKFSSYL
ncbi:homoserine kinase [Candidatus Woesearchaeota archaeon]|jgi:homoserine kinase type II|nr:homoserine kinase [Candidatus Woesearchaeota archaeon]MBT6045138.1 homoserine kinase [Candidatus Woesearchaeota archaeon]